MLWVPPGSTLRGVLGASHTDTGMRATCTLADLVVSAIGVAVITTLPTLGTKSGAVNMPLSLIDPQAVVQPERLQVTRVSAALLTVAVN